MKLPLTLNIGSGKDWREDAVNLDINENWSPDIVADLNEEFPKSGSQSFDTKRFGEIRIHHEQFDKIYALDVLEHLKNLTTAMRSCLNLLKVGGCLLLNTPYDLSYGAWQDPTHIRAFNERSWLYYTDWFWYLGWTEHRFKLEKLSFELSPHGKQLHQEGMARDRIVMIPRAVDSMKAELVKIALSDQDIQALEKYRLDGKGPCP